MQSLRPRHQFHYARKRALGGWGSKWAQIFSNVAAKRSGPKLPARRWLCGPAFCSHESLFMLVAGMTYPFRFAGGANHWSALFVDRLPRWAMVADPAAIRAFYEGGVPLFASGLYRAWLGPVSWWTLFVTVLVGAFLALDILMARRWTAEERLAFPLVEIPLALDSLQ